MKKIIYLSIFFLIAHLTHGQLYEDLPSTGEVLITLHPGSTVTAGSTQLVSFGVPFPRSLVNNVSQIIVTDASDVELSSNISETLRWHSLSDDASVGGVRSALIHVNVTFPTITPITLKVKYGQPGSVESLPAPQGNIKDRWVTVNDPDDPYDDNIGVKEPAVFATLPPIWMSRCVMRTKFTPVDQVLPEYQWHSDASLIIGNTFSTQFSDPYDRENYELWLFDRASSFWNLYMRTGELKWLRTAHKASQFYASGINDKGEFAFNPRYPKLMYCYGTPLMIDIMLTGDVELEDQILDIAEFGVERNFELTDTRTSLWTERGLAYWLLSALTAYEVTGEDVYKNRVISRFEGAYNRNPDGVMLHQMGLHEIGGLSNDDRLSQPIISPWMNALLSEAIWRYYLHSEDTRALQFIAGMGDHIARHCIYEVTPGFGGINPNSSIIGAMQPAYLWSGEASQEYLQTDPFTTVYDDDQHALDVTGLLARAYWAQKKLGSETSVTTTRIDQLIATSKAELERRNYGLSPGAGRKYNWQYGTTSDIDWLITNIPGTTNPPAPDTEPPSIPQDLVSTGQSETTASLSWNASTDNVRVTSYNIYRNGDATPVATITGTSYTDTGLTAATLYTYHITAADAAGNESSDSNSIEVTTDDAPVVDTEAPSQPIGLTFSNITSFSVDLNWNTSTDNVGVTGYNIYRNGETTPVATVTETSFTDTGLAAATTYSYTVSAEDAVGNESNESSLLSVTTEAAPSGSVFGTFNPAIGGIAEVSPAPGSTNVPLTSKLIVRLTASILSDPFVNSEGIRLYKEGVDTPIFKYVFSNPEPMAGQTEITFDISTLEANTNYYVLANFTWAKLSDAPWRTFAIEENAWRFRTGSFSDTEAPSIPQNLLSTGQSETTVSLSWNASTDNVGVTAYSIYRNGETTPLATVAGTSYTDTGLTTATSYNYSVTAKDAQDNESNQSSSLSITTLGPPSEPVFGAFNPSVGGIVEVSPAPGSSNVWLGSKLIIRLVGSVISDRFVNTQGIRLYKEGVSKPIFQYVFSDPEPLAGQTEITFDIPTLEANTNYYVLGDFTWAKLSVPPWRTFAIEENVWRFSTSTLSRSPLALDTALENKIEYYPNPVKESITISIPKETEGLAIIKVYDQLGKIVLQKRIDVLDASIPINLDISQAKMDAGIYFINIQSQSFKSKAYKLIKE